MKRLALLAATAVLLASCGTDEPLATAPMELGEPAPISAAVQRDDVPAAMQERQIVDPGWDQEPLELDGLLLGIAYPEGDGPLRFRAVHETGELLWEAERPPACTGFTLSRADGRPIAVLMDLEPGETTMTKVSASAYDLATGELVWGPEEVPGPHQGPGTVFAAPAPGAAMGETGPRLVLDPATGNEVTAESEDGDRVVVGEYNGVVLTAEAGRLKAEGGETSWDVPLGELQLDAALIALAGAAAPAGTVLLAEPGQWEGVLIDIGTGEFLATGISGAAGDPEATLITLEGDEVVGISGATELWRQPAAGAKLTVADTRFAYFRTDSGIRVLDIETGENAGVDEVASTVSAVPILVTSCGASVIEGNDLALVISDPDDDQGCSS